MTVRVLLALLYAALVSTLAACGGSSIERDSSAKGIITLKPAGSTPKAGVGSIVYVYDDGSSSTNGPIVKWEWNLGDGWEDCTATEGICPVRMDVAGTYVVALRVTDSTGKKGQEKIKLVCEDGFDAEHVFMVWGADESDIELPGSDGAIHRYHEWVWRTLSYDPESPRTLDSPVLEITGDFNRDGHPDVVVCRSSGNADDFCGIDTDGDGTGDDLDGDGVDDDPSLERSSAYWPHMHQLSGRCLGKSKEDVYVWKVSSSSSKKEFKGHVTLLK